MMSNWISFYPKKDESGHRLSALQSFNVKAAANPLFAQFQSAVCMGNENDARLFCYAVVKNILSPSGQEIELTKRKFELPMYDEDRQMHFFPEIECNIIGTEKGVSEAMRDLSVMAEKPRPFFEDSEFWLGDLDPEKAIHPRRQRFLSYNKGIPAGIMCQQHFAFVVTQGYEAEQIVQMLSTHHKLPQP